MKPTKRIIKERTYTTKELKKILKKEKEKIIITIKEELEDLLFWNNQIKKQIMYGDDFDNYFCDFE